MSQHTDISGSACPKYPLSPHRYPVCLAPGLHNCKGGDAGNTDAGGDAGNGGDGICGNGDDSGVSGNGGGWLRQEVSLPLP
ncbi:hypothetical protein Tco_1101044 [Tanacetum coccineum]